MVAGQFSHDKSNGSSAEYLEPVPPHRVCGSYRVFKILSVLYGIIFFLIGVLLLSLGLWVVLVKRDYASIHDVLTSPSILAIIVGGIIVTTSIVGLIGSCAGHLWCLRVFLGIVIVVFIIQVVIGILAFVYRTQAIENIDQHLNFAIEKYYDNKQLRYAVDKVQTEFSCCGLNNVSDWNRNRVYSCSSEMKFSCHVPDSCCKTVSEDCGIQITSSAPIEQLQNKDVHVTGCRWQFLYWLESNLDVIGATALSFAILHILGIFVVFMFIAKVEDYHLLFKYRKRYYAN